MVVILTAIGLVAIALGVARAISPRSYNPQNGEAYECGIPTRGKSWMQFKVGYYLFATSKRYSSSRGPSWCRRSASSALSAPCSSC